MPRIWMFHQILGKQEAVHDLQIQLQKVIATNPKLYSGIIQDCLVLTPN